MKRQKSALILALTMVLYLFLAPAALAKPGEPFLGVLLQELDDDLREHFDYKGDGIMIFEIIENTGADKSELEREDIITAIGGKKITGLVDIKDAISTAKLGEKVDVTVLRNHQERIIPVEISGKGESAWEKARKWIHFPKDDRPWIGIALEELTAQLAAYFETESGVLVKEVFEDSPAEKADLRAGDVIFEWNGEKIESTEQMFKKLDAASPGDKIRLAVMRKGKKKKVKVVLAEPNPKASHLYELGEKDHHRGEDESEHWHPGREQSPMPYFRFPENTLEKTEDRLTTLEKKIEDLAEKLITVFERLETKINDKIGDQ